MRKDDSARQRADDTEFSAAEPSVPEKTKDKTPKTPQATAKYHTLAVTQSLRSAAWQYLDQPDVTRMIGEGAVDLYQGLEPKNGLEAAISMLLVGVTNAALDCTSIAARISPQDMEARELNLRCGFKGAQVAAQLAETLQKIRGNAPKDVKVGQVNVESGGQAIVGNVSGGGKDIDGEASPKPKKPKAA